jgi:hypothetical protein
VVEIVIHDDKLVEPDKDFRIILCEKGTKDRMKGDDTRCKVTIIDNDNAGHVGFTEVMKVVRPRDQICLLHLKRDEGTDGDCTLDVKIHTQ